MSRTIHPDLADGAIVTSRPLPNRIVDVNGRDISERASPIKLRYAPGPRLSLPTRSLIAGDLVNFGAEETPPLDLRVPVASADSGLVWADFLDPTASPFGPSLVAVLYLWFDDAPIVRYRNARRKGGRFGFPRGSADFEIDHGYFAVADASALSSFDEELDLADPPFDAVCKQIEAGNGIGHAEVAPGLGVLVCQPGRGDGVYACSWGLRADGSPVCLIADFGLIAPRE